MTMNYRFDEGDDDNARFKSPRVLRLNSQFIKLANLMEDAAEDNDIKSVC